MKKFSLVVVAAIITIILYSYFGSSLNQITGLAAHIPEEEGPAIKVLFCGVDDCNNAIMELISNAGESVHCALYSLRSDNLKSLLGEASAYIDVKIITDDRNSMKKDDNINSKTDSGRGLMHNKFCIIDKKTVITGSYNPKNNEYSDENNIIILSSKVVADNYESEFSELWDGLYRGGYKVKNPLFSFNGNVIENYFCPEDMCESHVIKTIASAKHNITFLTYSFTSNSIESIINKKSEDGLKVRGVIESSQISKYSADIDGDVLVDRTPGLMHDKVFIIDSDIVITGSYNPTRNGNERNDENILIIHNKEVARLFLQEFERIRASVQQS